ncbi:hypothetical protein JCM10213_000876 [Rhodosporidiobolus nylandii]
MPEPHIVILGSGIVGLSCAYYALTLSPSARVTLVEASSQGTIAGGASSNSGGFIAAGSAWHEPPSRSLARLSWDCHVSLAERLNGAEKWGWRECGAVGLAVGGTDESRSKYRTLPGGVKKEQVRAEGGKLPPGTWVEGEREELSTEGGVGQLDPAVFCRTVYGHLSSTYSSRFTTIFGKATSLSPASSSSSRRTLSIRPHPFSSSSAPTLLALDKLVIAAGPWSAAVCSQLALPPIPLSNLPGHSLLIRPSLSGYTPPSAATTTDGRVALPSEALFAGISGAVGGVHASTSGLARGLTEEEKAEGYTRSPELFVRTNGLIFVAGENAIPSDEAAGESRVGLPNKLPGTVDEVKDMLDKRLVDRLKRAAGAVSPLLKEENGAVIVKEQFCYRPVFDDREPVIGELEPGVIIATGHGPWGITLAPGTGKVVAELALGRKSEELSADISSLGPQRFQIKAKL